MNSSPNKRIADDASIRHLLGPILSILDEDGATEICINEPGVAFVEKAGQWEERPMASLTFETCYALAIAIAQYTQQQLSPETPIMAAALPNGERIQVIIPPACERRTVSITIRIPSPTMMSMTMHGANGIFKDVVTERRMLGQDDVHLQTLLSAGDYPAFFEHAVQARKNIAIVGDTGSGKTTFMKTLCQLIAPTERLVTIEDVREIFLPAHKNKVHLTYSAQADALAAIDAGQLVKTAMRMRPDRVLLAELRGAEAFEFLDLLTTGHAGSMTSFHAESCGVAFDRFALMCKKHDKAQSYAHAELLRLLHMSVDVIAHVARRGTQRRFTEIYFDPAKKFALRESAV